MADQHSAASDLSTGQGSSTADGTAAGSSAAAGSAPPEQSPIAAAEGAFDASNPPQRGLIDD